MKRDTRTGTSIWQSSQCRWPLLDLQVGVNPNSTARVTKSSITLDSAEAKDAFILPNTIVSHSEVDDTVLMPNVVEIVLKCTHKTIARENNAGRTRRLTGNSMFDRRSYRYPEGGR